MAQETMPVVKNMKWLGVALIVLGVVALLAPAVAGGAVVIMIGLVMILAGAAEIMRGLGAENWSEKILTTILGLITGIAGIVVIGHPLLGLAFLTLLLVVFFVLEGVWKIVTSFRYRPAQGWMWLLISGLLSLFLGVLIWNQWPVSGLWAVGILVGVNLLSTGMALITLAAAEGNPDRLGIR